MAKSIKELKKENSFLKGKSEKSDITLIELVEEVCCAFYFMPINLISLQNQRILFWISSKFHLDYANINNQLFICIFIDGEQNVCFIWRNIRESFHWYAFAVGIDVLFVFIL